MWFVPGSPAVQRVVVMVKISHPITEARIESEMIAVVTAAADRGEESQQQSQQAQNQTPKIKDMPSGVLVPRSRPPTRCRPLPYPLPSPLVPSSTKRQAKKRLKSE